MGGGGHSLGSFKAIQCVRAKTKRPIYVPFENTVYLVPWIQIRQVSPKPSVGDTSTYYLVIYYSQKLSWTLDSPTWPPFYSYYFSSGRFRETFAKLLSDEIIEEPSFLPLPRQGIRANWLQLIWWFLALKIFEICCTVCNVHVIGRSKSKLV